MLIDLKEHPEFVFGAASIKKESDGSLRFRRQTDELYSVFQHDGNALWNYMAGSPAGVRVAFRTNARKIRMKLLYDQPWSTPLYTGDTDIVIDQDPATLRTFTAPPLVKEDNAVNLHEFTCELEDNGSASRMVEIFLCNQVPFKLLEFEIDSEELPQTITYDSPKKILFLGDSITQGYFATPAKCYASRYARHHKADFYNVAIGGAVFRNYGKAIMAYPWNELIICFGTNDCNGRTVEDYRAMAVATLDEVTKRKDARVILLSSIPFHATHYDENTNRADRLTVMRNILKELAEEYGVRYVDGTKLVPDEEMYFTDRCHPNAKGMEVYGNNLIAALAD